MSSSSAPASPASRRRGSWPSTASTSSVLEAGDDVGGRVRTDRVDGLLLDRGFQLYNPAYPEAAACWTTTALDLRAFVPGVVSLTDRGPTRLADPRQRPRWAPDALSAAVRPPRRQAALRGLRMANLPALGGPAGRRARHAVRRRAALGRRRPRVPRDRRAAVPRRGVPRGPARHLAPLHGPRSSRASSRACPRCRRRACRRSRSSCATPSRPAACGAASGGVGHGRDGAHGCR